MITVEEFPIPNDIEQIADIDAILETLRKITHVKLENAIRLRDKVWERFSEEVEIGHVLKGGDEFEGCAMVIDAQNPLQGNPFYIIDKKTECITIAE